VAIFNRGTGNTASTIAGQVSGNGQVYLINPNGIAITSSGTVQVGGLVASSLDIANSNFMAGKLSFYGAGGAVSNSGKISVTSGGFVALLGGAVSNLGLISAPLGRIVLSAAAARAAVRGTRIVTRQCSGSLIWSGCCRWGYTFAMISWLISLIFVVPVRAIATRISASISASIFVTPASPRAAKA